MEARQIMESAGKRTCHDDSYASQCVSKWQTLLEETDRRDPIKLPRVKRNTAILMENLENHLLENTTSDNAGYFTKYAFPVLRRVWPNLIANQIVSVQPMTSPVGAVFYYEKKYTDRKGQVVPELGVANDPNAMNYTGKLAAGDEMVKNFAQNYSREFVDFDEVCTDTGAATAALTQASANSRITNWSPIRDNGTVGQRTFYVKAFYRILDADDGGANKAVVATMNNAGNLIDDLNGNTVGTFNIANGQWSITPLGSAGNASNFVNNTTVYFQYFVNWEQVGYTAGSAIPSVSLDITMKAIQPESRKLRANWTVEAVEDMRAMHGVDAEHEIVDTFANDVLLEIDRQIIGELVNGAMHQASYAYAAAFPGEIESIRHSITMLNALSAKIHRTSQRGQANFIVCGPDYQALLENLSTHADYQSIIEQGTAASYGPLNSNYGITQVGVLKKKWAVYVDPYMDPTKVLIGLKGRSYYDAGYVYAPYIPLSMTPTFLNPDDQTNRKGVWSRYATKMLRPEYYGVLNISGLPTVTSA